MLQAHGMYAYIPASDVARARRFYEQTLGFKPQAEMADGVVYACGAGTACFLYPTPNAGTLSASQAFWQVDDIDREVAELKSRGVTLENYDMPGQKSASGVVIAGGAKAAWFKDSEGNIMAVIEDESTGQQEQTPPSRGAKQEALAVFLGAWKARGQNFGGSAQQADNPKAHATPWTSTHTGRWHTGNFFLVQDERATVESGPFDTLSIMGWDESAERYFAKTFENHGFCRHYDVEADGRVWTFSGASERARIEFSADGATQTIAWQWHRQGQWMPLCDRVAVKAG